MSEHVCSATDVVYEGHGFSQAVVARILLKRMPLSSVVNFIGSNECKAGLSHRSRTDGGVWRGGGGPGNSCLY